MNFKDIIDLTKNRIDELDSSVQIDTILKSAINDAYRTELAKYDKRIQSAVIPVINGIATLPDDIDTIEKIIPPLVRTERKVGNSIITSINSSFTVIYSYVRDALVNDNDELDMSEKFKMLLSTYACYLYFEYRKKTNIAQMFLDEYRMKIALIMDNDILGDEYVNDDYASSASVGGDE